MALIKCPDCGREVSTHAAGCPGCGHPITRLHPDSHTINRQERKWSPGVAAVLSLIIPGAGQMYKGSIVAGLLWLLFVVMGYSLFIVPGVILHLFCIFRAASGDPTK